MTWRDPILPVDALTGAPLPEPKEVDRGPDMPIGGDDYDDGVFCPFSSDGTCPDGCLTPRQRACTGYGEED